VYIAVWNQEQRFGCKFSLSLFNKLNSIGLRWINPNSNSLSWYFFRLTNDTQFFFIGCVVADSVDVIRDLRVVLDSELTTNQHINNVVSIGFNQLNRLIQLICYIIQNNIKPRLPFDTKLTIATQLFSVFQPRLIYHFSVFRTMPLGQSWICVLVALLPPLCS